MVKYPYGPLVQRAAPSSASLLSLLLSLFFSHLSVTLRTAHPAPRQSCVLVFHFLQHQLHLSTKESSASVGALRLRWVLLEQSHASITRRANGHSCGICQSIRGSNQVRVGRLAAIGGCYRGMVFVVREPWNSLHDQRRVCMQVQGNSQEVTGCISQVEHEFLLRSDVL